MIKNVFTRRITLHQTVKLLIDHYKLSPLPAEGTLYSSTWRSTQEFPDGNPVGTAMIGLYCDEPPSRSVFHRLPVDEVWHFYAGDPFRLIFLNPDGSNRDVIMGPRPLQGHQVQCVIPAGVWQAGHLLEGGVYALFGCTVSPGFTGSMYEGGKRESLIAAWPSRKNDIIILTLESEETNMPEGFAQ